MVAAELTLSRAEHRRRMEAKARAPQTLAGPSTSANLQELPGDADGGRSSSSLQPLEPALEMPLTEVTDTRVVCGGLSPPSVSSNSKYGLYCVLHRKHFTPNFH